MELHINKTIINEDFKTVIIVHGIAEHSKRYQHVELALNKAGYNTISYDQRGHGLSPYKRGAIKSFHDFVDDLHEIVTAQKDLSKVYLLGHSMGGLIVHLHAAKYGNVAGIISSGAATKTPSDAKLLKYIGFWYLRNIKISTKRFGQGLSRDKEVLDKYLEDPLVLKHIYLSLIGEMFIKGVKYLSKNSRKITVPIIYLHGALDPIVSVNSSTQMYEKINSKDKTIKIYPDSLHEIYNELNKEEVINDTITWLDKH